MNIREEIDTELMMWKNQVQVQLKVIRIEKILSHWEWKYSYFNSFFFGCVGFSGHLLLYCFGRINWVVISDTQFFFTFKLWMTHIYPFSYLVRLGLIIIHRWKKLKSKTIIILIIIIIIKYGNNYNIRYGRI